jgi:hypothetical protein
VLRRYLSKSATPNFGSPEPTDSEFRREYRESFDMSWVYHDSA